MHEWPLIIFTLLMQITIGCVVTVWYCHTFIFTTLPDDKRLKLASPALLCALLCGGIGLLASVAHLGNPWHALFTLSHVASSWMSREILFTALFMGLLFLTLVYALVKKQLPTILLGLTALVGVADIFVMSAIYDHSRFILWQGWGTYVGFYGSAFMMGSLLYALCLWPRLHQLAENESARVMTPLLRLYLLGFVLATFAVIVMFSAVAPNLAQGISIKTAAVNVGTLTLWRYLLLGIALALLVTYVVRLPRKSLPALLSLALMITITGEFLGRYAFFSVGG
ncbi:TPA: dimethyl sulfoxide reductase anchor subunit [Escherichia coli]|nr:dimethyl sulfoxide reductase anchor subunit [Escherichia coli]